MQDILNKCFDERFNFFLGYYSIYKLEQQFDDRINFKINSNFKAVITNCAKHRLINKETWINQCIINTYIKMHELGCAHSIECWDEAKLVGGLYGLHLGSCFFGESMFNLSPNTSKFCLLLLISFMIKNNFLLLDSQFYNPHLLQFGAYEISDKEYQSKLTIALKIKNNFPKSFNYLETLSILQTLTQTS